MLEITGAALHSKNTLKLFETMIQIPQQKEQAVVEQETTSNNTCLASLTRV
jgi:hypothetical protein